MLYVGCEQSNPDMNSNIRSVNEQMKAYCASNDMIFIQHSSLQTAGDDMFDDDVQDSKIYANVWMHSSLLISVQ